MEFTDAEYKVYQEIDQILYKNLYACYGGINGDKPVIEGSHDALQKILELFKAHTQSQQAEQSERLKELKDKARTFELYLKSMPERIFDWLSSEDCLITNENGDKYKDAIIEGRDIAKLFNMPPYSNDRIRNEEISSLQKRVKELEEGLERGI